MGYVSVSTSGCAASFAMCRAVIDGFVKFEHKSKTRFKISVYPAQPAETATA